jgi:hypothetical protein
MTRENIAKLARWVGAGALALGMLLASVPGVRADGPSTWQVTDCTAYGASDASGTLAYALANAASGDTIEFACVGAGSDSSVGDIKLDAADGGPGTLDIEENLTLDGGTSNVTLDGGDAVGVLLVAPGASVVLEHLTIAHGSSSLGGGILNEGDLTVRDCVVDDNQASDWGGAILSGGYLPDSAFGMLNGGRAPAIGRSPIAPFSPPRATLTIENTTLNDNGAPYGAAVFNFGQSLTLTNSTLNDNQAQYIGGALINIESTSTVSNSTFSGNQAQNDGGAIFDLYGSTTLSDSTLNGNQAETGGALFSAWATDSIGGSALAGNQASDGGNCFVLGDGANDLGYNVADDSSCGFSVDAHDVIADDAGLGSLGNYGGPTQTVPLLEGSPAIGIIPVATPMMDMCSVRQRMPCPAATTRPTSAA